MTGLSDRPGQLEPSIDVGAIVRAVIGRLPRIVFVTIILCAIAFAVLMFVPRQYDSSVGLLVEPRSNVFTRATSDINSGFLIDEALVASQMELIRARDTILAAVDDADLRAEHVFGGGSWSDSRLASEIADNLRVVQERSSRLITVTYRSTDPELSARVANAIAQAHIDRRAGQQISDTREATTWLDREIDVLRESVADAERQVAEFRVTNDLFMGSNNTSLTDQQLSELSTQITAASERRNAARSRAQLIHSLLDAGQSVTGVNDVQSSTIAQQLSQDKARLQAERAQRSATLLSNHPTIRALDAQIAEIDAQISEEGRRVADALEVQARIEADLEASLREELERLKLVAGSATREGVTLAELEREATAQRELLNAYLIRHTEAMARTEVDSALPDVRVVSAAAAATTPAFPRTTMILLAIGLGSVTLQVGGVIFSELLSGRALSSPAVASRPEEPETSAHRAVPHVDAEKAQAADVETPVAIFEPTRPAGPPKDRFTTEIEVLAALVRAGSERRIVVVAVDRWQESRDFAERLSASIVSGGQSVAEVDAASRERGAELGLTDLCDGNADFGDVVHRGTNERFAFVPWGQGSCVPGDSSQLGTLVDALADVYEAVIVAAGRLGQTAQLALFAAPDTSCVLVADNVAGAKLLEDEIAGLGFSNVRVIESPPRASEVA